MRNELEQMALIEHYLSGTCTPEEKVLVEKAMAADASFRQVVELVRELQLGITRSFHRERVNKAARHFKIMRILTRWILPLVSAAILVSGLALLINRGKNNSQYYSVTDTLITGGEQLAAQVFEVNTASDTVIASRSGLVLVVPAHCWLHPGTQQPAQGRIQLVVKEALDGASIMRAGLSTFSGNSLLESGGMFAVAATAD